MPALALAALVGATPAWSAAGSSREEARSAFSAAQKDFAAHHYAAALRGYQHAYTLAPLPALLFDIAQCERKLHQWAQAESDYRRYLAAAPTANNRALAQTLAEEMHAKAELAQLQAKVKSGDTSANAGAETSPGSGAPGNAATAASEPESTSAQDQEAAPPPHAPAEPAAQPSLAPQTLPNQGSPLEASTAGESVKPSQPIYKTWWFWTGVGVVAAGTATAAILASKGGPTATTLGEVNLR